MSDRPIWIPNRERIAASNLSRFVATYRPDIGGDDYSALHRWSVDAPTEFWPAVAEFCALRLSRPPDVIIEDGDRLPGARWFVGARLNYAENLLERDANPRAIVGLDEGGRRIELDRDELRRRVASFARALDAAGVGVGDRVAGILPNCPETVIAALATASIGAVWSSCSPDFGKRALLDRLGQIEPKVVIGTAAYRYNGKVIDCLANLRDVTGSFDSLAAVFVVGFAASDPDLSRVPRAQPFAAALEAATEPNYVQVPFDHPLFILFSSGTTGVPKCIVHGVGGTLLQHAKEHVLHTDIHAGDRLFYFTTCGWMMWNWLVSSLASDTTLVLYDGAPFHPDPGSLWRLAEHEAVDIFGTSAKYLSALETSGFRPADHAKLDRLRTILSTGSPLAPASFDFVADAIGADVQCSSIAGGTDLISCFMLGNPTLPVFRGEIQSLGLGMDVDVLDPAGNSLREAKGELVCRRPFPSMPVGFWNDADGSKYHDAYFDKFPGVWAHGDYAEITVHGGVIIHGRSDAVLNAGGVRIGTSEIYRVVEQLPEIDESIAVGQDWLDDTRIVLFVRLRAGDVLDDALRERIKRALREHASPRHVPARILAVDEIPRTISGKITELAVRDVIHGREVTNLDAIANPQALDQYRSRPELAE